MAANNEVFRVARVNRIMRAIQDEREIPKDLLFLRRTKVVPALEGELMARFTGRVQIADLVTDDSPANVYQTGKYIFEGYGVPNLKHGVSMGQEMLNEMSRMQQLDIDDPEGIIRQWERNTIQGILDGIRHRMEALIIAMHLDSFSYNRFGVIMNGVTWGKPADLKVTPSPAWTNTAATVVDTILHLQRVAKTRYGQMLDQMDMSTTAFNLMIATTQFQSYVRNFGLLSRFGVAADTPIPADNTSLMVQLALPILGLKAINLYDQRYWSQDEDGTWASAPFLPINKVILSSMSDNNNPAAYDFSNGIVTESLVSNLVDTGMVGKFMGPTRGPVSYVTPANHNLNPPGLTYWGVGRGFPRYHKLQASAVLTVGTFTDDIPVGPPF